MIKTLLISILLAVVPSSGFTSSTTRPALAMKRFSDAAVEAPAEEAEVAAPAPAPAPAAPTYTCQSAAKTLESPNCLEFGSFWDPLGLSEGASDEVVAWYRHAEVKHGRVAMAAFVGWCVVGAGFHLNGELSHGLNFADIPKAGLAAWDATPGKGKVQMLLFAGLIEFHDELFHSRRGKHYLRGGVPGRNVVPGLYDPFGLSVNRSEADLARGRDVEIKNGRLAMIGFIGMYSAAMIKGSIPFITWDV